jgi:copper(I)-binding protein
MRAILLAILTMVVAPLAVAQSRALSVENAWIMTPSPGASEAAAYVTIRSGPAADRLLSVSCDCAARADLHEMSMNGAVMTMRLLRYGIAADANATLTFGPHGIHIMLVGLTAPLLEGQAVPLRLTFREAGVVTVAASVRRH